LCEGLPREPTSHRAERIEQSAKGRKTEQTIPVSLGLVRLFGYPDLVSLIDDMVFWVSMTLTLCSILYALCAVPFQDDTFAGENLRISAG